MIETFTKVGHENSVNWVMLYLLDDERKPIRPSTTLQWGMWMAEEKNVRVAFDKIRNWNVSTVFLGIQYGIRNGKPLLWETLVTDFDGDTHIFRFTSEAQALSAHESIVEEIAEFLERDWTLEGQPRLAKFKWSGGTSRRN